MSEKLYSDTIQKYRKKKGATPVKHYSINPETKVITARIARLTAKELAEVQNYVALGFKIEDGEPTPPVVKRLDEDYIIDYLNKHLTADEAEKAKAEYKTACDTLACDDNGTIKTRFDKISEKEEQITQGFNAGRNWFAKTYPRDITELNLSDKVAEKIEKAYETYKAKGDKANEKAAKANKKTTIYLTEEEYTRYYYWTKIFQQ